MCTCHRASCKLLVQQLTGVGAGVGAGEGAGVGDLVGLCNDHLVSYTIVFEPMSQGHVHLS
jgi:hypothetical protein